MTMFTTEAVLRVHYPDDWVLEFPLRWDDGVDVLDVPPGFVTDLATIPRLAQPLIPVNDRHRAAAILHDYLYAIQDRTRAEADALFERAMAAAGVGWLRRTLMHAAVRIGGWVLWNGYATERGRDLCAFLAQKGIPCACGES
jgi:hypothetical protein